MPTLINLYPLLFLPINIFFMKKIFTPILLFTLFFGSKSNAQLSGVINLPKLPSGPVPALFTLAAAVNYLNLAGISGTTIINCSSNETAPSGGYVLGSRTLNDSLRVTGRSLTINGAKRVITAQTGTGNNDAIFTIQGANYVTLQNFDFRESAANTTATAMMERGVSIVKYNKDTGTKKDNILNTSITLNNTNTTAASGIAPNGATGIFIGNCTYLSNTALALAAAEDGTNDGIFISGCVIKNVTHGIYASGIQVIADGSTFNDKNITITSDTIENFTHHGIFLSYSNGDLINACRINNLSSGGTAPTSNSIFGIRYANTNTALRTNTSWDCHNNNINLTINTAGTFAATGIYSQLFGSGSYFIETDTVQLTSQGSSAQLVGIFCQNKLGNQNINRNVIQNFTTQTTNTQSVLGMFVGGYSTFANFTSGITDFPSTSSVNGNTIANFNASCGVGTAPIMVAACLDDNQTDSTSNFTNNIIRDIVINASSNTFLGYGGAWLRNASGILKKTFVTGNTFSNISVSGTVNTTPISILNPGGSAPNGHSFTSSRNIINGISAVTGGIVAIAFNSGLNGISISDTISDMTSQGQVVAFVGGTATNATKTISVTKASVKNLSCTNIGASQGVVGMAFLSGTSTLMTSLTLTNNLISNLSNTDTLGNTIGLNILAGSSTNNISNNIISDINGSKNTTVFNSSFGINANNAGTNNIIFNTVRMVSSATAGSGYGATALRYNPSGTNTIQNNILHVNVLAGALNNVSAIRGNVGSASAAPSTSAFTAGGNIYYSPTGVNNYLYVDGTTNSSLVNGYHQSGLTVNATKNIRNDTFFNSECNRSSYHKFMQTGSPTREVRTFTEDNLAGTGGVYAPSGMSFAEAAATDGAIGVDFLGNPRPFGSSDIGALEFAGTTRPQMLITITSSTGFDTACTFNLPSLSASIPPYFTRVSYQWYRDTTKLVGKTLSNIVVTALSGNYIVKVYDSVTGCEYPSNPYKMTIVPPPPAQISYYDSLTFCESSAIVLNANKGYNYIYQWARNGIDLPGETEDHLVVDKSGNYTVEVNTPLGCPTFSTQSV